MNWEEICRKLLQCKIWAFACIRAEETRVKSHDTPLRAGFQIGYLLKTNQVRYN
jgi:hypothetical protein